MATKNLKVVNNEVSKMKQSQSFNATSPVRIKKKTKGKLDDLLLRANKNHQGKKIKADDIVGFSLDLLNDAHLEEICSSVLSNKDRLEILYAKLSKGKRSMSKEDFYGIILEGKLFQESK